MGTHPAPPGRPVDATVETFDGLVRDGHVLVDVWGPHCAPCIALMPAIERLAEAYASSIRVVKVNAPEHRKICRDLRVAGLPAYLTLRDGVEVERVTGDGATADDVEAAIVRLLEGAPAVGPPVPEHLRGVTAPAGATDDREGGGTTAWSSKGRR